MVNRNSNFSVSNEDIKLEIKQLHDFFANWFNGNLELDEISRFTSVISDKFVLITPNGKKYDKQLITQLITAGFGTSNSRKIWVENITVDIYENVAVAEYYELQETDNSTSKRISSAVLSFDDQAPNNCIWERVHETWSASST